MGPIDETMIRKAYQQSADNNAQLSDITQDVKAIVVCTQTEYDLLTPVATTLYIITE